MFACSTSRWYTYWPYHAFTQGIDQLDTLPMAPEEMEFYVDVAKNEPRVGKSHVFAADIEAPEATNQIYSIQYVCGSFHDLVNLMCVCVRVCGLGFICDDTYPIFKW